MVTPPPRASKKPPIEPKFVMAEMFPGGEVVASTCTKRVPAVWICPCAEVVTDTAVIMLIAPRKGAMRMEQVRSTLVSDSRAETGGCGQSCVCTLRYSKCTPEREATT